MILTAGSSPAVFYSAVFSFASSRPHAARHTRKMLSLSSLFRMSFFHKPRDSLDQVTLFCHCQFQWNLYLRSVITLPSCSQNT